MRRMRYLGYQTIQRMTHLKKRYLLYIVSFYIGLLLPVFCIANYSFIRETQEAYHFKGMENSVQVDWFSSSFATAELAVSEVYSVKVRYQEVFLNWDNLPMAIEGRPKNYFYDIPPVKGRKFTDKEMDQGHAVCIIDMENSKKYHCDVGDMIRINNQELKVVGVISDPTIVNYMIIPFQTMKGLYQYNNVLMQYSGIFVLQENQDKEQFISKISSMVQTKDEHANILFTTTGEEIQNQAIQSVVQWKALRAALTLGAVLFFLINEMVMMIGKIQKDQKTIAIKMALGISVLEVGISYLIETICITFIADILIFLTINPLAKVFSLDKMIHFNYFVVIITLTGSIGTSIILALAVIHNLKKYPIRSMLTMEEA